MIVSALASRAGVAGLLGLLLAVSLGLNLWQIRQAGAAAAQCRAELAAAALAVAEAAARRDTEALGVATEARMEADAAVTATQTAVIDRQERIRVVYRQLPPIPLDCPRALPERVRDTLAEAAAAANRGL